jgi:hypothetical protein
MLPYFYQFKNHILNEEDCHSLRTLADLNVEKFWDYYSSNEHNEGNKRDGNGILGPRKMEGWYKIVTPGVKRLFTNITLQTWPAFIRHAPGASVITHVDDVVNKRLTVLSIPLWPVDNYPPTYFRNEKHGPAVATATFTGMMPCLLNTRCWHDLVNTSSTHRLNFQLCFDEPIRVVAEKVENNTLWKSD